MTNPSAMRCDEVREHLGAHLDAELPAEPSGAVERHLAECVACRDELEVLRRASASIRAQLPPLRAPDVLRARILAALRESAAGSAAGAATGAPPPAWHAARWLRRVAAGLVIAVASSALTLVAVRRAVTGGEIGAHDVIESHVRARMAHRVVDVASTDQHNVKPWFSGRVPFSPDVRHVDATAFPLVGGRVDVAGDQPVAAIVYGRRAHTIDVFTWPAAPGDSARVETSGPSRERGFNAYRWTESGMHYWAVSDLNVDELRAFVEVYRRAAAP